MSKKAHNLEPDVPLLKLPGLNRFQSLLPGIALKKRQGFGRLARIWLANGLGAGPISEQYRAVTGGKELLVLRGGSHTNQKRWPVKGPVV